MRKAEKWLACSRDGGNTARRQRLRRTTNSEERAIGCSHDCGPRQSRLGGSDSARECPDWCLDQRLEVAHNQSTEPSCRDATRRNRASVSGDQGILSIEPNLLRLALRLAGLMQVPNVYSVCGIRTLRSKHPHPNNLWTFMIST